MKTKMKTLAAIGAMALSLALGAQNVSAQTTAIVTSSFSAAAGIVAAATTPLTFGTWVVNVGINTDTPTIIIPPVSGAPTATTGGTMANAATRLIQTVAPTTAGGMTVTTPAATNVQMTLTSIGDFASPNLLLTDVRYSTTSQASAPMTVGNAYPVTVLAGNTPENIYIGASLVFGPASPTVGTPYTDGVLNFSFAY